ncbi:hypothetical protein HMPREF9004_0174 [Schaalia cardiffensis F0333]|uniref:Uncharacterized protein n=1 Tax=Schaalia cardiffensis F0333 TaxID=888050 RepID=N6W9K6_9ACTO|nr:hypothetical protein HMPREF9004_0174 [Schaalia cardiffensis F0333]
MSSRPWAHSSPHTRGQRSCATCPRGSSPTVSACAPSRGWDSVRPHCSPTGTPSSRPTPSSSGSSSAWASRPSSSGGVSASSSCASSLKKRHTRAISASPMVSTAWLASSSVSSMLRSSPSSPIRAISSPCGPSSWSSAPSS